jgi:single-strand DNA-binding protein
MYENQVTLAGYLGSKPEVRYLPSGTPVANARLAQTYEYTKDGKPHEHTNWFSLVFYGDLAAIALKFEKGDNIHVTARLERRQWESKTGGKRTVSEVVVHNCHRIAALSTAQGANESGITPPGEEGASAEEGAYEHQPDDDWVI